MHSDSAKAVFLERDGSEAELEPHGATLQLELGADFFASQRRSQQFHEMEEQLNFLKIHAKCLVFSNVAVRAAVKFLA
uniref:Uncharacterized protein n=1 Tax=Ascaris lumbricoides TaxID=6252 RepID=A0A0M3HLV7_ASCLU